MSQSGIPPPGPPPYWPSPSSPPPQPSFVGSYSPSTPTGWPQNPPPSPAPKAKSKPRIGRIALILVGVSVALVAFSLFSPWYVLSENGPSLSATETISIWHCEVVQGSYEGISISGTNCTLEGNNNTLALYNAVLWPELAGLAVGVAAFAVALVVLLVKRPWKGGHLLAPAIVSVVAAALLVAGPMLLMIDQPSALQADQMAHRSPGTTSTNPCGPSNPAGPNQTFFGGCTYSNISNSWGPGLGWWFSVGAGVALIVAAVLLLRYRKKVWEGAPDAPPPSEPIPTPSGYAGSVETGPTSYYPPSPPGTTSPYPAGSYPAYYAGPPPIPSQGKPCITCGATNPPGASTCHVCKTQLW